MSAGFTCPTTPQTTSVKTLSICHSNSQFELDKPYLNKFEYYPSHGRVYLSKGVKGARSLLKKSLSKIDILSKWDTITIIWQFVYAISQNIAVLWHKVGCHRKAIFQVGTFS